MEFYRYEITEHSNVSFDDSYYESRSLRLPPIVKLNLIVYDLLKETNKGYWIGDKDFQNHKIWVSKTSKKRFAYPTKEEALTNFIKRTEKRVDILKNQINSCKWGLKLATEEPKIEHPHNKNQLIKRNDT